MENIDLKHVSYIRKFEISSNPFSLEFLTSEAFRPISHNAKEKLKGRQILGRKKFQKRIRFCVLSPSIRVCKILRQSVNRARKTFSEILDAIVTDG